MEGGGGLHRDHHVSIGERVPPLRGPPRTRSRTRSRSRRRRSRGGRSIRSIRSARSSIRRARTGAASACAAACAAEDTAAVEHGVGVPRRRRGRGASAPAAAPLLVLLPSAPSIPRGRRGAEHPWRVCQLDPRAVAQRVGKLEGRVDVEVGAQATRAAHVLAAAVVVVAEAAQQAGTEREPGREEREPAGWWGGRAGGRAGGGGWGAARGSNSGVSGDSGGSGDSVGSGDSDEKPRGVLRESGTRARGRVGCWWPPPPPNAHFWFSKAHLFGFRVVGASVPTCKVRSKCVAVVHHTSHPRVRNASRHTSHRHHHTTATAHFARRLT
jgi:hypothetical protein